jgi:hypothetical protein
MRQQINTFLKAQKQLMKSFGCPADYFIKPMPESGWHITGDDEVNFLTYEQDNRMNSAVIVRQGGRAMVYRARGYVCVVAIDCVKIAFIFDGSREMGK